MKEENSKEVSQGKSENLRDHCIQEIISGNREGTRRNK